MCAAGFRITSVLGALIAVIAIRRRTRANTVSAGVLRCAGIAVVTGYSIQRLMEASGYHLTFIVRALIAVIAIRRRTRANTVSAGVLRCAGIAVVTGHSSQRLIGAACLHVAFILCTVVPVITDYRGPGAGPVTANVICRTCIRIIAGNPGQRLMCASHYRNAFIPGAGIPVIAIHRYTGAGPIPANVICRTDIVVITGKSVLFPETHINNGTGYFYKPEVRSHFRLYYNIFNLSVPRIKRYFKGILPFGHKTQDKISCGVGHGGKGIARRIYPCIREQTAGVTLQSPLDFPRFHYVPRLRILRLCSLRKRISMD
jgi:hypothetical protein